ncbi:MAG: hypothetical protein NZ750_09970 [Anaerolineae bacterium]|nr:hypothetical protein [Anaerolineae bacterium]MDW8172608.1 hypothetical protein [Anaerolineae bacterium]
MPDTLYQPILIRFDGAHYAPALRVPKDADPLAIVRHFGLLVPRPSIFLSGGASAMSQEDMDRVRVLIEDGIAAFAERHHITVIDGGTEAGIMRMMGRVHAQRGYKFPLIGVAPYGKVTYPGHPNPKGEAALDEGHTHFVLVEADEWGSESHLLGGLVRAISQKQQPRLGILINGGAIAERDVYMATTQGEDRVPVLVVDGTGRKADEISNAYSTGSTDNAIIRAIVKGGKIHVTHLKDGLDKFLARMSSTLGLRA